MEEQINTYTEKKLWMIGQEFFFGEMKFEKQTNKTTVYTTVNYNIKL